MKKPDLYEMLIAYMVDMGYDEEDYENAEVLGIKKATKLFLWLLTTVPNT